MAGAEWVMRLLRLARDWHARQRVAVRQAVGVFVAVDVAGSFSFVGQMMLNERRKDREALQRRREDEAFAGCERLFQRVFHRCETSNPAIWPLAMTAPAAVTDDGAPAVEWVRFEELLGLGGGGFYNDGGKAGGASAQPLEPAKVVVAHREGRRAREAGADPIPLWITAGVRARAAAAAAFAFGVERFRVQRLSSLRFSVTYVAPPRGRGATADPRSRELEELGSWCVDFLT